MLQEYKGKTDNLINLVMLISYCIPATLLNGEEKQAMKVYMVPFPVGRIRSNK